LEGDVSEIADDGGRLKVEGCELKEEDERRILTEGNEEKGEDFIFQI
jgi:hypothetical protein